jgi:hypothetical protein
VSTRSRSPGVCGIVKSPLGLLDARFASRSRTDLGAIKASTKAWAIGFGAFLVVCTFLSVTQPFSHSRDVGRVSGQESGVSQLSEHSVSLLARQFLRTVSAENADRRVYDASTESALNAIANIAGRVRQDGLIAYLADLVEHDCHLDNAPLAEDCQGQEIRVASRAEGDARSVARQSDAYFSDYSTSASNYEVELEGFVSSLVEVPWPGSMTAEVDSLISRTSVLRAYLAWQGSVTPNTNAATITTVRAERGAVEAEFSVGLDQLRTSLLTDE